ACSAAPSEGHGDSRLQRAVSPAAPGQPSRPDTAECRSVSWPPAAPSEPSGRIHPGAAASPARKGMRIGRVCHQGHGRPPCALRSAGRPAAACWPPSSAAGAPKRILANRPADGNASLADPGGAAPPGSVAVPAPASYPANPASFTARISGPCTGGLASSPCPAPRELSADGAFPASTGTSPASGAPTAYPVPAVKSSAAAASAADVSRASSPSGASPRGVASPAPAASRPRPPAAPGRKLVPVWLSSATKRLSKLVPSPAERGPADPAPPLTETAAA